METNSHSGFVNGVTARQLEVAMRRSRNSLAIVASGESRPVARRSSEIVAARHRTGVAQDAHYGAQRVSERRAVALPPRRGTLVLDITLIHAFEFVAMVGWTALQREVMIESSDGARTAAGGPR